MNLNYDDNNANLFHGICTKKTRCYTVQFLMGPRRWKAPGRIRVYEVVEVLSIKTLERCSGSEDEILSPPKLQEFSSSSS